ncbi:hypothetical protein CBC_A1582 [Clostridium botulinum C str. Eklund]|nr:hypothetical protein CBC_A1582 [Clostridium botulinum C str. Eklund]
MDVYILTKPTGLKNIYNFKCIMGMILFNLIFVVVLKNKRTYIY